MQCTNHPEVDQGIVRCLRCARPYCADCVVMLRGYWYCAQCKTEQVRDIQSGTATGLLELASVGRRLVAMLIDGLLMGAVSCLLVVPFFFMLGGLAAMSGAAGQSQGGDAALGLMGLLFYPVTFAVQIGLPLVYESWMLQRNGQTLGKMALSLRVVTPDGEPLTRGQAWGRSGLKVVLAPTCSCLGVLADDLPTLFTAERTALHDMAARTRVVRVA